MGLFDYLSVPKIKLPGKPPSFIKDRHSFQTKSFDDPYMTTYEVTDQGTLLGAGQFTGEVDFYDSNIVGGGPGYYTRNGEDAESVDYLAKFVDGMLVDIKETERELKPALPASLMHDNDAPRPTKDEIAKEEAEREASYVGKSLFLHWGSIGPSEGHYVTVVAEDDKNLCVKCADTGKMKLLSRWQFGSTLFLTKEDDAAHLAKRDASWKARQDAYDARVKEWELARSKN